MDGKAPVPESCNFIKKETRMQVFSCEFRKIFKNIFLIEHFTWLLLKSTQVRCGNWKWIAILSVVNFT